jgi:iron-sulfur cluster repair protein YtfE (RIC family)
MLPSQVRRMILDDHHWLRELLADARETARQVALGDHALCGRLRERAQALRERFLGHLALEEQSLVPALHEADAWGAERAARLLAEHADQRARFSALLDALQQPCGDCAILAREVLALADDLLADIETEERTLLDERVLHDDPVVVDGEPE